MKKNKQVLGNALWVAAAAATMLGVVACGSSFSGGDDCKASRTCAAEGGEATNDSAGAPSGNATSVGGAQAMGGAGDTTPGDAGGAGAGSSTEPGGAGGAAAPECRLASDCSNGDPADGDEACKAGSCVAGNPPPRVVSITPDDQATGVALDGSIVVRFSEPLDPATVTTANFQLLDGATAVDVEPPTYADNKVTFKPKGPLSLLTPYSVSVSVKVTDVQGAGLLAPFKSKFVARDGVWTVNTAVDSAAYQVAPNLPVADDGQALVTWIAFTPGHYCPATAVWFNRGQPVGFAKKLNGDDQQECATVRAAGSGDGRAVVSWREDTGNSAAIYKGGVWQAKLPLSGNGSVYQAAVAYGPGDITHYLEVQLGGGINAYWWKGDKWTGDPLAVSTETALSEPQMAVAKSGRVFAVWRARDAANHEKISSATYEPDVKKWGTAEDLKGSTSAGTTASYERGAPTIALDENGDAMALWIRGNGTAYQLMASRYRAAGWEDPSVLSGALGGLPRSEPAALVFDGKTFVAAFTAVVGAVTNTYVARFDRKSEAWGNYELVSDGITSSLARMPRLGADAHQNLLLTWPAATGVAKVFDLAFQRYNASKGAWATVAAIPGGTIDDSQLVSGSPFPLGVGANGLAASMWGTRGADGLLTGIQLASFY